MIENWFKAAASSLAGVNGLPQDLSTPEVPETGSGAGWLDKQLRRVCQTRKYKKVVDALVFVEKMDLRLCRANSRSFDKLCRELAKRAQQVSS